MSEPSPLCSDIERASPPLLRRPLDRSGLAPRANGTERLSDPSPLRHPLRYGLWKMALKIPLVAEVAVDVPKSNHKDLATKA